MAGGRRLDRRAPVPIREGRGCQGEDVRPAVARDPVDGPERRGTRVLGGGDRGDPRDLAWSRRSHRPEDDRAGGLRGRTRGPGPREPDRHEHGERRRRTPGPPEAPRRTPVDDQTRCPPVVPPPDGPPRLRLRHRQHGDQRRDRAARREREGTGGPIPRDRECGTRNRPDHPGRIGRAPPQRPRRGRTSNGPEPHPSQSTRRGSSNARPPGGRRAEDELRREAHRGRRRRAHRGPFGPPRGDHRGDSRRGRKSGRRHIRPDRSGEPFLKPVQAHKIRATPDARAAGPREHEVDWKAKGMGYREIAARGGGILHTVRATRDAREEDLVRTAAERLRSMLAFGTTTIEVKSGYGLRTADELKILRVAAEAGRTSGVDVVRTFLGAHAIPPGFEGQADAYLDLVGGEMGDAVATARLPPLRGVFVGARSFSAEQGKPILGRAKAAGLATKVHADELADSGGAALAADLGAASADHPPHSSPEGIDALARTAVVGVLLPAA